MRLFLIAFGIVVAGAFAPPASAEVVTPPNCHWAPATAQDVVELWCRGDDGRARPTGQTLVQRAGATWDGCPRGLMYDGVRCVSEARAIAAARGAPPIYSATSVEPPARTTPDVWVYQDRRGRNRGGLACADKGSVRVCRPIPHY